MSLKKLKKKLKKAAKKVGKVYSAPYKAGSKLAKKAGLAGVAAGLEGQSDLLQGKSAKKALKKLGKAAKQVGPAVLGIAGGSAVLGQLGSSVASGLPQGVQNAVGGAADFLNRAGKYAGNIKSQLDGLADQLGGFGPEPLPPAAPNLPDSLDEQGPQLAETDSTGGIKPQTLALFAAAGVAVLLLLRKA